MKKKLRVLLSGFLVFSMAITATPALANEVPASLISVSESSSIPTETMALDDKTIDGKSYNFSAVEYSPNMYTTNTGILTLEIVSHKPDYQYFQVRLHNATTGEVKEITAVAPEVGIGIAPFDNLSKSDKYYFEIENTTGTDVIGTFFIKALYQ